MPDLVLLLFHWKPLLADIIIIINYYYLGFKYDVFDAWRLPVWPKHVACVDGTSKFVVVDSSIYVNF